MIPGPATVSLSVEEAAVTEAWLNLHMENIKQDYQVTLWRDSVQIYHHTAGEDTLIYDSGLLPARSYTYQVNLFRDGTVVHQSEPVTLTTMDTTSHEFTWRIDTIGTHSSVLYDVAIINENDIWAVGEIHTPETDRYDSLGNWIPPFNAVHWDGTEWELKRFYFYSICGQSSLTPYPAKSIISISSNDIWVAMDGDQITHWNGNSQDEIFCSPVSFSIKKLYPVRPDYIFAIGRNGNVLLYNGINWSHLSLSIDVDLHDIWSGNNSKTGKTEILLVGSNAFQTNRAKILIQFDGPHIREISSEGLPWTVTSLWFMPGKRYYVVGDGVFSVKNLGAVWQPAGTHPLLYKSSVRGNDINDVIVTGAFGLVSHFNGMSWHHYVGEAWPQFDGNFGEVAYKNNFMVAVGRTGDLGLILRGWRH